MYEEHVYICIASAYDNISIYLAITVTCLGVFLTMCEIVQNLVAKCKIFYNQICACISEADQRLHYISVQVLGERFKGIFCHSYLLIYLFPFFYRCYAFKLPKIIVHLQNKIVHTTFMMLCKYDYFAKQNAVNWYKTFTTHSKQNFMQREKFWFFFYSL